MLIEFGDNFETAKLASKSKYELMVVPVIPGKPVVLRYSKGALQGDFTNRQLETLKRSGVPNTIPERIGACVIKQPMIHCQFTNAVLVGVAITDELEHTYHNSIMTFGLLADLGFHTPLLASGWMQLKGNRHAVEQQLQQRLARVNAVTSGVVKSLHDNPVGSHYKALRLDEPVKNVRLIDDLHFVPTAPAARKVWKPQLTSF